MVGVPITIYLILRGPDAQRKIKQIRAVSLSQLGPDPSPNPTNFLKTHPHERKATGRKLDKDLPTLTKPLIDCLNIQRPGNALSFPDLSDRKRLPAFIKVTLKPI